MARRIECPECGETEDLRGTPSPEGIRIECESCGRSWLRDDESEQCATCGGTKLVRRPLALTQYSRGTQLSIVGVSEVLLCEQCDARMVEWSCDKAVPVNYRPAATVPGAGDVGNDAGGDVLMTP
ncbi:MAG: hypothetical protein IBX62_06365 [Coriobacteriia bacterium]|nr:hypothetical protein [Coriobacteriia bacterium]